jgi:hypothetical protein
MATPSREELREWSAALTLDPLDPFDPAEKRYVALQEAGRGAVDEMMATIELSIDTTTQLLSGPSGSGKTTELHRLRGNLTNAGYRVGLVDITRYVSESSPVDVTEFLIALALGAHDVLGVPAVQQQPDFTRRLSRLLSRLSIKLNVAGLTASLSSESVEVGVPGASVGVDLKQELKSSEPFVAELRQKLSYHLGSLYEEVAGFLGELLSAGGEPPELGAVLIVDGLEKLRGTTENDLRVQESIEALFVNHANKLKFGSHHLIYTVPTYLLFTSPGALPYDSRVLPVPVPHVRPRNSAVDSAASTSLRQLREVVGKRIPVERVFGERQDLLDRLIYASGGHLRDMFTLVKQLVNLMMRRSLSLPVGDEHVDEAITLVAHDFSSITKEQADFLRQVAQGDGTVQPAAAEVQLMARLLQSHMLLGHLNGTDWYEVHPLAMRALEMA